MLLLLLNSATVITCD